MKTILKKKLYNGMVELRDYERDNLVRRQESVKIILDNSLPESGQYMILSVAQLKKGKPINTQHSIYNQGQTYKLIGWRWQPTGRIEEQISIDYDTKLKLKKIWDKLK